VLFPKALGHTSADKPACFTQIANDPVSMPAQILVTAGPRDQNQAELPDRLSAHLGARQSPAASVTNR